MVSLIKKLQLNLRYLGRPPWDTRVSPPELLDFINTNPGGDALDIGCGTGTNCLTLAKTGWKTTGIDLAWLAVIKARRRFSMHHLEGNFIASDVTLADLPTSKYDLILDIGCYHSLPSSARAVYRKNLNVWLKPGGSYLLYGHMPSLEKPESARLGETDIDRFSQELTLENRKDCVDAWQRQTVWLHFTKSGR